MQRVLVTGGLGYLGSVACEHLLAAGYQVTALDNLMYGNGQGLYHLCANPAFDASTWELWAALLAAASDPETANLSASPSSKRQGPWIR